MAPQVKDKNCQYKVQITEVKFRVCYIDVSPDIIVGHAEALKTVPAIYPFTRSEIKNFSVAKGSYNVNIDDVFQGDIPTRLIIGLTSASAFSGDYEKNPYNFRHCFVDFLAVYVNSVSVPGKPLQPNFDETKGANYISAYHNLFTGMGKEDLDLGIYCTRKDFAQGYTLFVFHIEPHINSVHHEAPMKKGNLKIEMHFAKPLEDSTNLLVYANFPSFFEVDQARNVIL